MEGKNCKTIQKKREKKWHCKNPVEFFLWLIIIAYIFLERLQSFSHYRREKKQHIFTVHLHSYDQQF